MTAREQALEVALRSAREYFDQRSDVRDGDYGVPEANEEMRLLTEIDAALALPPDDGWRPIESARLRMGTYVLVTNEEAGGSWVASYKPVYQSGYRPNNPWHSMMLNNRHLNKGASWLPTY